MPFTTVRPPVETLYWLIAALVMAAAPHVPRLPLWDSITLALLAGWSLAAARLGWRQPRPAFLLMIAGAGAAGIAFHYHTLFGRDAGVALLSLMLGLKLLEVRSPRDVLVAIFLAYFLTVTQLLYSQNVASAAWVAASAVAATAALASMHDPAARRRPRSTLRLASVLLLQALPLTVALFVLFPRIPGPLWGLPKDAYGGSSGLSDEMSPGSVSKLILSDDIALRADFRDARPPRRALLYWRGPVLWHTDGRRWTPGLMQSRPPRSLAVSGTGLTYTVIVEPHDKPWLFALDLPVSVTAEAGAIQADFQVIAREPVKKRLRYEVTSYPSYSTGELTPFERRRALQLPADANPRATALGRAWRQELGGDPARIIERALLEFRKQNYSYTLEPRRLGANPVDEFLFDSREGFCEHYSAAFTWVMRAAGIPARVVTGYQGGDVNPITRYMVVRQSDAHAWSEVWLANRGWVRVDPTAWVSPARVQSGIDAAVSRPGLAAGLLAPDNQWLRRLGYTWDALNTGWNQWVLGYNHERQFEVLSRIGLESWGQMALALAASLSGLLGLLWAVMRAPRWQPRDAVQEAYRRFCAKLARRGLARQPAEGPQDYAARVARARPDIAGEVAAITRIYTDMRYAEVGGDQLAALRARVRTFRA